MWKAFRFLVVILIIAAGGAWLADHPGEFIVTWFGYRIETSFTLVSVLLVGLAATLFWLYRLTLRTLGGPGALMSHARSKRAARGQDALRQGLVAVAAGNPSEVRKLAARANSLLNDPPLTLLLSAQAAQLEGDDKRAAKAWRKMLDNPETEFLGLRGLFLQSVRSGNRGEALGLAERAFELQPETPWVFTALFELQSAAGHWADAAKTLEQSVSAKHIDGDVAQRRRAVLYTEQGLDALHKGDTLEAEKWGLKAADLSPGLVPAAVLAARHHMRQDHLWKAARTLEKAWTATPHPDLALSYAAARKGLEGGDQEEAKWLKGLADFNRNHMESRLLRAEQDLRLKRFKGARKGLSELAQGFATARVCKLMADLETAEGRDDEAHRWLSRTVNAPRDAHWMCDTCGREAPTWTSTCNNCGAFDTLSWKAPSDLVAELVPDLVPDRDETPATPMQTDSPVQTGNPVQADNPVQTDNNENVIDVVAETVSAAPEPDLDPDPDRAQEGALAQPFAPKVGASNPLTRETLSPDALGLDDPGTDKDGTNGDER